MSATNNIDKPISQHPSPCSQPRLPRSMSGLIEIAIADARSLDRSLYHPKSRQWHSKPLDGPCEICLAGSVIAGTYKSPANSQRFPWFFGIETEIRLNAIDSMRCGQWSQAFFIIYGFRSSASISNRLNALPKPAPIDFDGWSEFHDHLASLEALLPSLREIDAAAAASYPHT